MVAKEVQEDFTGTRLDRPGLGEIREMIARGELQALVVYEADRLSRKLGHLLLLQEEFDRLRADLLFVNSQDDTGSPEGRMFFQMRGAFAEYEKTKITERFRLGKLRTAKQGRILGNRCQPLGYDLQDGRYVVIEEEAQIVRQIFHWLVDDRLSLRQIAVKLTGSGAVTKQGSPRWQPSSIKSILANESYAGTFYWGKTEPILPSFRRTESDVPRKVEKTSKRQRDRSEWIAVECPAIISRELWEAAQRQLEANKKLSRRNTKHEYLLRGMLRCGLCGSTMFGCATTPTRIYYRCGGKDHKDPYRAKYTGKLCPQKYLRVEHLETRVWDYIREQITDEEKLLATFEMRGAGLEEELRRDQGELESLYAAEGRLAGERNKMLDLYSQDLIDKDVLQERLASIQKRAEAIAETKAELLARIERRRTATATTEALKEYCSRMQVGLAWAESNGKGIDYRRELLEMLETQVIIDDKDIHIAGIITGQLPLFDADPGTDEASQLRTTNRYRMCLDGLAACSCG
jgi:site-specific DNA recombinase